jgi:hypothetical protein
MVMRTSGTDTSDSEGGFTTQMLAGYASGTGEPIYVPVRIPAWSPTEAGLAPAYELRPMDLAAPAVPGTALGGDPADAPAPPLAAFSDAIGQLIVAVNEALGRLRALERGGLAPGAFHPADNLLEKLLGPAGPGEARGLLPAYEQALAELASGLTSIQRLTERIGGRHPTTEALSRMTAADLRKELASTLGQEIR